MTFVHGRSPLGYLRFLRGAVIAVPLLTVAAMTLAGTRYEGGAFTDPESGAFVQPALVPLWALTILVVFAIKMWLTPESPMVVRYIGICVAYLLALVTSWISLVYSLSGSSPVWAVAGYVLAIATVGVVSLARYAADVSPYR